MMEIKIKLVAIAKDEAAYLPQWIFHHLRLGVDSIDVYINDSFDNSIEISRKINAIEPRFKYHEADKQLKKCIKRGKNFQKHIYQRAFRKCARGKKFSHLLILDLDEYLMPDKLENNLKNLIHSSGDVSVISFPWCIDAPREKILPFQAFLSPTINIRPHKLVKSIGRIDNIKTVLPHGFILNAHKDELSNHSKTLSNGTCLDSSNSRNNECILGTEVRKIFEDNIQDSWFTFHRVNKSEVEYLASLLRGRPSKVSKIIDRDHVNSMIKNNREGYILFDSVTMLQKNYHQSSIQNYYQEYNEFIGRLNIASESEQSQEFILSQLGKLNNLIKENPTLVNTFKKQFAGTRYSR